MPTLKEIQKALSDFAKERDWDQFHSPKNLVMALTSEVGELNGKIIGQQFYKLRDLLLGYTTL